MRFMNTPHEVSRVSEAFSLIQDIRCEIVARIETERVIVDGNRELIRLYEEKAKKIIERVWEGK